MKLPRNLELLVKKAVVDPKFFEDLLARRSKLADEIGVSLDPVEKEMLDKCDETQLKAIISHTQVTEPERKALKAGCLSAALLGGFFLLLGSVTSMGHTITDQGRASATRAVLSNLKTAVIAFSADIGKVPHTSDEISPATINQADEIALGLTRETNILVNPEITNSEKGFTNMGISSFLKRWKGPYMDSDPGDFMRDAWENKIRYLYFDKKVYFYSSGSDGRFDGIENALKPDYSGDDLFIGILGTKF